MMRNRCFIIFLFYYYNNILRRERCRLAHYVIFSSFIFFYYYYCMGLSTGDRPQPWIREGRVRVHQSCDFLFSFLHFFFLLQPMWILIPTPPVLVELFMATWNESESEICRLLANRPTILYNIMLCNTILYRKLFDKITLQKLLQ